MIRHFIGEFCAFFYHFSADIFFLLRYQILRLKQFIITHVNLSQIATIFRNNKIIKIGLLSIHIYVLIVCRNNFLADIRWSYIIINFFLYNKNIIKIINKLLASIYIQYVSREMSIILLIIYLLLYFVMS